MITGPPTAGLARKAIAANPGLTPSSAVPPALQVRGVVLHLDVTGERVIRLYGHEATTLAALESAPLLQVRRERLRPRG